MYVHGIRRLFAFEGYVVQKITMSGNLVQVHVRRDWRSEAAELRDVLVALSGRQMKRGVQGRRFTEPALLVGLGVMIPMLALLEHYALPRLRKLARLTGL